MPSARFAPQSPLAMRLRAFGKVLNFCVAAFVAVALATIVLSNGHPPGLSAEVRLVQHLPSGGLVVYGTIHGSFGPLRRGFGQAIGSASLDLITSDGRFLTLQHRIEEAGWLGALWPLNWLRREVWFSEVLPPVSGFERIRARLTDRLKNDLESPDYPLTGGSGSPSAIPDDVRWLALPAITLGPVSNPISADDATLLAPLR